jgi:hypothetical protein
MDIIMISVPASIRQRESDTSPVDKIHYSRNCHFQRTNPSIEHLSVLLVLENLKGLVPISRSGNLAVVCSVRELCRNPTQPRTKFYFSIARMMQQYLTGNRVGPSRQWSLIDEESVPESL